MKRLALTLAPLAFLAACAQESAAPADGDAPAAEEAAATDPAAPAAAPTGEVVTVGTALTDGEVLASADAATRADALDGQTVRVEGTISEVCQQAGCWMVLQAGNQSIRVLVPRDGQGEYVYTFPKDVAGATAVLEGTLAVEESSVETQRHLAEDAGQTSEQIAAITAPKREVTLTATGARITRA